MCCDVMPASRRRDSEVKSSRGRVKRPTCADTPALAKMRSVVSRRYGFHAFLQQHVRPSLSPCACQATEQFETTPWRWQSYPAPCVPQQGIHDFIRSMDN